MKDWIDEELDALEAEGLEDDLAPAGRVFNIEHWRKYLEIVSSLEKLLHGSEYVKKIQSLKAPIANDNLASLTVVFTKLVPFTSKEGKEFARILGMSDGYAFTGTNESVILTIVVSDIWEA